MRILLIGLLAATALAGASTAHAADFDDDYLRGPEYEPVSTPIINWGGAYIGAHAGYSSTALGFANVDRQPLSDYFRGRDIEAEFGVSSLLKLNSTRIGGASYGGFAGYNFQFDEGVIGIEADYTRFDKAGASVNEISRLYTTSAGGYEYIYLKGASSTQLEDFGTVRGRVGYAIGSFLPFVTGGLAIGRATITDETVVQNYGYDRKAYEANQAGTGGTVAVTNHGYYQSGGTVYFNQNYPANNSTPTGQGVQTIPVAPTTIYKASKSKAVGGIALGAGLEYAITSNILLRAEYQYVLLNDFDGHKVNVNTVRGGAAYKF